VAEGEFLIAQALGIDPAEIWPSRYFDREGNPIDRKKLIRDRRE
jgi:Ner family transcriptional regulator